MTAKCDYNSSICYDYYSIPVGCRCASGLHTYSDGAACSYWQNNDTDNMATQSGCTNSFVIPVACSSCQGGGNGPGSPPSPTPHPGSGGGSTSPTITCKRDCPPILEEDPECDKITSLVQKPVVNQPQVTVISDLLNQLNDSTTTTTKEMGYFLNPTDATEAEFVPLHFEGEEGADEVELELGANAVSVFMHLHYNNEAENKKQLSVFSLQDLYEIYQFIGTGHIFSPSTFASFVTTENGTNYAIQISDLSGFVNSDFATKYFIGWEFDEIREIAESLYDEKKYGISPIKTNGQNELAFTKFLTNENLGLTVFRANNDFTEFTKLEYENGTFKETPCN